MSLEKVTQQQLYQDLAAPSGASPGLKLIQFRDYVKRRAKLLISLKQDNYSYLYALQEIKPNSIESEKIENTPNTDNIKDCFIAPIPTPEQVKTVYKEDNSLSEFMQINCQSIERIRYVEKPRMLLCGVEVNSQNLILPEGLKLQWLTYWEVDKRLQVEDKEDYQALLLKV